jgi:integrase
VGDAVASTCCLFHDLRHSCATLLLGEGVHPKVVSDLLGHSQIGITLDLYSHVSATMQAVAAEAMGRLLGGQDDSQATDGGHSRAP